MTCSDVVLDLGAYVLGALDPGTKTADSLYKKRLEAIVDLVVSRNAMPGAANLGSALNQIRTNETAFDPGADTAARMWQLREHKLRDCMLGSNKCLLSLSPVQQTPHNSVNRSAQLDAFLTSSQDSILAEAQSLPPSLGTLVSNSGSGPAGSPTEAVEWNVSSGFGGSLAPLARHLFGLSTCNGCHYSETGFDRMHIHPRKAGEEAAVSAFLSVTLSSVAPNPANPGLPLFSWTVRDPVSGETRELNEPWRRVCEMRRVLAGVRTPWTKSSGAH